MIERYRHFGDANDLAKEEINDLLELSIYRGSAIYFLCYGSLITYIGQTARLFSRIGEHVYRKEIKFNRVFFIPCPTEDLNRLEDEYIRRYMPSFGPFDKAPEYMTSWTDGPLVTNRLPLFILEEIHK